MAEIALAPVRARTPFEGLAVPGRYGRQEGPAGLVAQERQGVAIVHCAAFRGQAAHVRETVKARFGLDLPETPLRVGAGDLAGLWAGPGQWLVMADAGRGDGLEAELAAAVSGAAAVTGIGDGRAVLRIAGPASRRVLAKGVAIDLDPARFPPGATAMTVLSLIDVQVSAVDEATYEIMLFRGFAGSFWHWLEETALEEGFEVRPAG